MSVQVPKKYADMQLFVDLSQYMLKKCKSLIPITKALQNHNIVYHWGYQMKLTVTHNTKSVITSLAEGLTLLRFWNINPSKIPNLRHTLLR